MQKDQKGFTIIELMIATSVFAVVLVVAASGILTIGRIYYKGLTSSRVQEVTRSVSNTIASTIQFSGHTKFPDGDFPGKQTMCFGYDRYTYIINSQVTDANTIGLRHDRRPSLGSCAPIEATNPDGSIKGTEFLPQNTRLLDFRAENPEDFKSNMYRINVKIAYGADDLFEPDLSSAGLTEDLIRNATCRPGIAGSSFCAISELETIVKKRVK